MRWEKIDKWGFTWSYLALVNFEVMGVDLFIPEEKVF